jgi:acyl-CoA dehydrogenase
MNFEFSDDQHLLREQARGFLESNSTLRVVRSVLEGDAPYDEALWRGMAELGWMGATIPEAHGGVGLGYLDLCVIAEELGRALAPVPFSSSVYLATEALIAAGSGEQKARWLPKLASGECIGTFALADAAGEVTPRALTTRLSRGRLSGTKLAVPDGDVADFAIVAARSRAGDGAGLYLVELQQPRRVVRHPVRTIDLSRSHANIELKSAICEPLGDDGAGWALTRRLLDRAAVLFAWEQVGGAQAAADMAKSYALERYAFGRPIGSYQAIKHKLANMYVKNTLARSNCYYGAWALNADAAELPLAAATARVSATQAYYFASKENLQTHGGMGFTWEFDCQFYYRRAKLLSVNIGSEREWQDRLVGALEARSNEAAAPARALASAN